jgi:hypothetical protein
MNQFTMYILMSIFLCVHQLMFRQKLYLVSPGKSYAINSQSHVCHNTTCYTWESLLDILEIRMLEMIKLYIVYL